MPWSADAECVTRLALQAVELWGEKNDEILPYIALDRTVQPGETYEFKFAYVGPQTGKFENQWILKFEFNNDRRPAFSDQEYQAYFGTPVLVETEVYNK